MDQYARLSSSGDRFTAPRVFRATPTAHTCVKNSHVGPDSPPPHPPPCHVAGCGGDPADQAGAGAIQPGSTQGARGAPLAVGRSGAGRIMSEGNSVTGPISTVLNGNGLWRACTGRPLHVQLQACHTRSEPGISSSLPGVSQRRTRNGRSTCAPPPARHDFGKACTVSAARATRRPSPAAAAGGPAPGGAHARRCRRGAISAKRALAVPLA